MDEDAIEISVASRADAAEILALIRAAFRPVADDYGLESLPPLEETLDQLTALFDTHVVLKACHDGRIVGSVRAVLTDGTCEVGRLVVSPASQGRGIGTALARAIEERFPDADRFELFTGHRSAPTLRLYRKLGYRAFRTDHAGPSLDLVYLEKRRH